MPAWVSLLQAVWMDPWHWEPGQLPSRVRPPTPGSGLSPVAVSSVTPSSMSRLIDPVLQISFSIDVFEVPTDGRAWDGTAVCSQ